MVPSLCLNMDYDSFVPRPLKNKLGTIDAQIYNRDLLERLETVHLARPSPPPFCPRSRCHLALVQTAEQMTSQTSGLVFDMCDMHDYDHMHINKYACTNPFEYMKNCKNLEIDSKLLLTYESSDNRDHIYITLNAFGQLVMQLACDKNVTAKCYLIFLS